MRGLRKLLNVSAPAAAKEAAWARITPPDSEQVRHNHPRQFLNKRTRAHCMRDHGSAERARCRTQSRRVRAATPANKAAPAAAAVEERRPWRAPLASVFTVEVIVNVFVGRSTVQFPVPQHMHFAGQASPQVFPYIAGGMNALAEYPRISTSAHFAEHLMSFIRKFMHGSFNAAVMLLPPDALKR
mmetsp:Transcript_164475/g.527511  ORF Transcript_164475/g.527511 Transcript_164475/m.527511 type:complete len:185 (+) Transcript_164475:114-668(+)